MNFDLSIASLHRKAGQYQSSLPGLLTAAAPRRAARGRNEDRLVMQLSSPAELNLSAEAQASLLQDMADGYFRSPGAVTSALREQIERLNAYFLQRNQQIAQGGTPAPALLSLACFRENRVTLAQCGPVYAFVLGGELRYYHDEQLAGRGLGLGQNAAIHFTQFEMQPGQFLLTLAKPPSGWKEATLQVSGDTQLRNLRRRLLGEAGSDLQAVLVGARPGKGQLQLLSNAELDQPAPAVTSRTQPVAPTPTQDAWEEVEVPSAEGPDEAAGDTQRVVASDAEASYEPEETWSPAGAMEEQEPAWQQAAGRLSEAGEGLSAWWNRMTPGVRNFLDRILPEEPVFNLPRRVMGLIAILVPILVVILVAVVYLQFGRSQLYVNYLERAQSAAAIASASKDLAEIRQAWEGVVYYAERAAHYEQDQQTANQLLAQARNALDKLDGVKRMEFSPALYEPLDREAKITRMVATNNEIYLLNSATGSVLRAFLTGDGAGGGYQWDTSFRCSPGVYGSFIVSNLVDLSLLPSDNAADADIIAMDANGNVLYCAQGKAPAAQTLLPPDSNWGNPSAMRIANGNLYILDKVTNAVWIYFGEDYSFPGEPRFFFAAEVPNLRTMQDLVVDGDDLILLDEDGHMAKCVYGEDFEDPTTCEDPATLTDTRPAHSSGATIIGANFQQMRISSPPQPSLFVLDPVARSVYRFSLALSLDTQFQSLTELPEGLATAFAITPNRAILLAIDNDVYIGFLPSE